MAARGRLDIAARFQHEPARSEEAVTNITASATKIANGRQEIKRAA
jgi:hypothetical protein